MARKGRKKREETPSEPEDISNEEEDTELEESSTDQDEEKVEIVDETYRPKIKAVIDESTKTMLKEKKLQRLPSFKRQEWFRYKRLGDHWRKPKGLHSKMRANKRYRPPVVRVGYRTPTTVRDIHPSGFQEVLIHTPGELDVIDPEKEAVRIGRTVGMRKRLDIIDKADSLNIRILNRRGL